MKLKKYKEPINWLLISSLCGFCVCYFACTHLAAMTLADQRDVAKVIISLFGTFLGFLFTLLAIIASLSSHQLVKKMTITGHYANLMLSSKILSVLLFSPIIIYLITLFFIIPPFFIIATILSISAMVFGCRTIYKFFLVLNNI